MMSLGVGKPIITIGRYHPYYTFASHFSSEHRKTLTEISTSGTFAFSTWAILAGGKPL